MRTNRKIATILLATVLAVTCLLLIACKPDTPKNGSVADFTVKVIGPDGKPFTGVQVQPCLADGTTCFNGKSVDSTGTATFDAEKDFNDANINELVIHLLGCPSYLEYDEVTLSMGHSITVSLKMKQDDFDGGSGIGTYNAASNKIELSTFDPYKTKQGVYQIKFTSADSKIYFQFQGDQEYPAIYKVYSIGEVDASITLLSGNKAIGLTRPTDAKYTNDNMTDTDKNFSLEFTHDDANLEQVGSLSWFEVSLVDSTAINKTFYIVFEYVNDL